MSWLQILLASIHYIAFGLGLWAIFERGRCFKRLKKSPSESESLQKALFYDNLWAIAAILIIGTGLVKAFGHIEKPSEFYLKNGLFHAKLTLVFVIGP
ncbi:MAG: DUF2214 family protein [Bdellovibrionales bacterium]|nr:DUF2214 family protein [Bdellovibrionales bacterium]